MISFICRIKHRKFLGKKCEKGFISSLIKNGQWRKHVELSSLQILFIESVAKEGNSDYFKILNKYLNFVFSNPYKSIHFNPLVCSPTLDQRDVW